MSKTRFAVSGPSCRICSDIKNDVVRVSGIVGKQAGWSGDCLQSIPFRHVVQVQDIADAPGDIVVRAGSVSADSDSADDFVASGVESQASAKNIDTADFVVHHGIGFSPCFLYCEDVICMHGMRRLLR
jgi:hypothetical protein